MAGLFLFTNLMLDGNVAWERYIVACLNQFAKSEL